MRIRHVLCIRTGISTECVLGLPKTYAHTNLLFPIHTCLLFHVFSLLYPHTYANIQLLSFTRKSSHMQINKCDHVKHIHMHNYVSKKKTGKLWCHCRMVYLPMCYLYCTRFKNPAKDTDQVFFLPVQNTLRAKCVWMYGFMYIRTYRYGYMYTYIHMYMYEYIYIMNIQKYIHTHTHTYTHTLIFEKQVAGNVCKHMCIYVCMYIHIFV